VGLALSAAEGLDPRLAEAARRASSEPLLHALREGDASGQIYALLDRPDGTKITADKVVTRETIARIYAVD